MKWRILEYQTMRGESPVAEFIKSQQPQAVAKIARIINLLEAHGLMLGMPHAKPIDDELYELRVRGKEELRVLYSFVGGVIYLLHGFKKQTQKTSDKELEVAVRRLRALKNI